MDDARIIGIIGKTIRDDAPPSQQEIEALAAQAVKALGAQETAVLLILMARTFARMAKDKKEVERLLGLMAYAVEGKG
jgi:hypothetical protein